MARRRRSSGTRERRRIVLALAGWVLLLAIAVLWGRQLLPGGTLNVKAPPFLAYYYRFAPLSVLPAALFAAAAVVVLPTLARWLPWRLLLPLSAGSAVTWAVLLAYWDGHQSLGGAIARENEYLPAVAGVGANPGVWLTGFVENVTERNFPVHVNGHPPLMVLVFWLLDRVGLEGEGWAGALVISAGASSVAAIAVILRALGEEQAARRALPFLVLAPFAITVATSADAFFLGVAAWGTAALAVGLARRAWFPLLAAGLLIGALPYLSYGLLPFGSVLLAVLVLAVRRSGRPPAGESFWLGVALVVGVLIVPVTMTLGGFWWPDGVQATRRAWELGKGDDRPYLYSFVANFAILGVLVGPATVAAAATARRTASAVVLLPAAALTAVLALAVSGVTRLEVERIWLPFAPWMVVVTALLAGRGRYWLGANAMVALVFQVLVRDVW